MPTAEENITHAHKKFAQLHTKITRKKDFFPGQRQNEEVKLCVRTHWIREARIFVWFFFLGILLPGMFFYFFSTIELPQKIWLSLKLIIVFHFLFAWLMIFIEFIKSEFTILVATNERIVDISQVSLFNRQISETGLDRIQEVSGFTQGIWRSFLDVGRLEIQTAGTDAPIVIRFVKSPQLTARKILDVQRESQQQRRGTDLDRRKDDSMKVRQGEDFSQEELEKMRSQELPESPSMREGGGAV